LHRITTVGFDAVTGLLGNQRRGHAPTAASFFRQIAVEPVATWARFIDQDQVFRLGLELADEMIEVGLSRADGAQVADFSAVVFGDVSDSNRFLMDIHADVTRARLCHG